MSAHLRATDAISGESFAAIKDCAHVVFAVPPAAASDFADGDDDRRRHVSEKKKTR